MVVYELTHMFFRYSNELVYSPKKLGLYYSFESIKQAVKYYSTKPGFCENQDFFSAREKIVLGKIIDGTVYEAIIYLHSEDYEFETEIELGLYGDEVAAQNKLIKYCNENNLLVNTQNLILEKIVNKCLVERKEWPEGFSVAK